MSQRNQLNIQTGMQILSALGVALLASCSNGRPCPTENACTTRGATQCVGALVQSCEPDSNCCLQWTAAEACDAGSSCSGGNCAGPTSCTGQLCLYSDSCGVVCQSGSGCEYTQCATNLSDCNQGCISQCGAAPPLADGGSNEGSCLTPCQTGCTNLHVMCCTGYIAQYPHDTCE